MKKTWAQALGLLVVPLVVTMAAWACSSSSNPAGDAGALDEYAPKSSNAAIKAVSLGTSNDNSFDPERTGTQFPTGTVRVLVWYRWSGADESLRIENVWYEEGQQVLQQGEVVGKQSGDAAWFFNTAAGGPLPDGNYEVRLVEDGTVVATIPFKVGD